MMSLGQVNFQIVNFVNYRTNNLPEFLKKINLLKAA